MFTWVKYAHIFPPLDTTTFDCVHKRHCAFDISSRTLKKSHTTLLVAMLVQNTEQDKKTLLLNWERFYYILNERGVSGDRLAACINDSITKWKFTQTKILKKCLLFPLIFQLYFIEEIGNLVPHWKELENLPKELAITAYFTHCSCVFQAESFLLQLTSRAVLVTNTLIPTSIFVSYCRMSTSNSEKGEIEISLIVVGTPKLRQKDNNTDFQVFLSEIWKLGNNRQMVDYELTIFRLPIIENLPIKILENPCCCLFVVIWVHLPQSVKSHLSRCRKLDIWQ